MEIFLAFTSLNDLPDDDLWLGPNELKIASSLKIEKRQKEWRLGRFAAKRALRYIYPNVPYHRFEILAHEDGAPEVFMNDIKTALSLSITHREEIAIAALTKNETTIGCDLEAIEKRTQRFVNDFFTENEKTWIATQKEGSGDILPTLIWSGKEAALKVLRTGLRRDTRSVELSFKSDFSVNNATWQNFSVKDQLNQGISFQGKMLLFQKYILTICSELSIEKLTLIAPFLGVESHPSQ